MIKEDAGSYESKHCALVDLFDKAVAEGARPNTENEVGTLPQDIEI